jgi:SAM-dependent methyltransferase
MAILDYEQLPIEHPRFSMAQEKTTDINVTGLSSDHGPDKSGWSAALYNKTGSFAYSPAFTAAVVDLLAPQPGERIIDFGCGTGEVTLKIEKAVREGGVVVGVDFSESMVSSGFVILLVRGSEDMGKISQARANGLKHAFVSDIQNLELPAEAQGAIGLDQKFDAVFSNAALHWCKRDPRGALESARRVLKPGGRFVGEMGGFLNCIGEELAVL